jgi:hypothetical protein
MANPDQAEPSLVDTQAWLLSKIHANAEVPTVLGLTLKSGDKFTDFSFDGCTMTVEVSQSAYCEYAKNNDPYKWYKAFVVSGETYKINFSNLDKIYDSGYFHCRDNLNCVKIKSSNLESVVDSREDCNSEKNYSKSGFSLKIDPSMQKRINNAFNRILQLCGGGEKKELY